jgi:uncharacterized membrane protein YphA (DoxX/SURF4 family)
MKKNTIIYWIATTIIALWEGLMPIATLVFAPQYITFGTEALGYPDYFAYSVLTSKVLGVIALVYPSTPMRIKEWAYAGFSFVFIFAFISHAFVDQNPSYMLMPIVFLGILGVSYTYHHKINTSR